MQLVCAFVFAYAKSRFSHEAAQILNLLFAFLSCIFSTRGISDILAQELLSHNRCTS